MLSTSRWFQRAALVTLLFTVGCPREQPVERDSVADSSVADVASDSDADAAPADGTSDADADAAAEAEVSLVGTLDDVLRLNHVQTLGTHNSYHLRDEVVVDPSHAYDHLPLDAQLDLGVRAFELDIHNPQDLAPADDFAVYHIFFLDAAATCTSLKACLTVISDWSDQHPLHVPIAVWIEPKGDAGGGSIADIERLDDVISDVVAPDKRLTPAMVQGNAASLREALETTGWPTLGDSRGKILFCLLDTGDRRDDYTNGLTAFTDRLVFVGARASEFGEPWAAVAKINDPGSPDVAAAHTANVLAASNLCLAGAPDGAECTAQTAAADANGSQWLKTDYPQAGDAPYSFFRSPGCNPVTAPPSCIDAAVE